jgi:hypothetical protein
VLNQLDIFAADSNQTVGPKIRLYSFVGTQKESLGWSAQHKPDGQYSPLSDHPSGTQRTDFSDPWDPNYISLAFRRA